jgi:hypothetical protein
MKKLAVLALLLVAGAAHAQGRGAARGTKVIHTGNQLEGTPWTSVHGPAGWGGPLGWASPSAKSADPAIRSLALFKPSTYISRWFRWSGFADVMRRWGGPTSERGILGKAFDYRAVPREFRPGGRYALVGVAGILGINSLRGLAGDTGAHGFLADLEGNYRNHNGSVVRTFVVGNGARAKPHALYEIYDERSAERMKTNDTSFAVAGLLSSRHDTDTFTFTSRSDQHLVVAVVPEKWGQNYNLTLRDQDGRVMARSDSHQQVNHVNLWVPRGTKLSAEVSFGHSLHILPKSYKFFVVGEND